ncbi:MAG: hypothetical protein HC882_07240 [Acidobacteria bacterium]|nr:hypothetical protein [Acidobacteriota bacterium]
MNYTISAALLALGSTLVGSWFVARWFPIRPADLRAYLTARAGRLIARAVIVLVVIGIGIETFDAAPVAVTVGALAGWLIAAGAETKRLADAGRTQS